MAQQQGQRQIAGDMGAEMFNLDKLTAQEDAKLAGERVKLDLGEVKGAQLAARDAQEAAAAYTTQGMQSAITAGTQAISTFVPLFAGKGVDIPTNTAGTGDILNPIQTPLASAPQGSQMQFAPQAQRAFMPQGNTTQQGSPLSQFQIPALGAMNRSKLDLMSREELLKLLTGGK